MIGVQSGMQYFIEENGQKIGPFDFISMIRKIRCGRLTRKDVVYLDYLGDRVTAGQLSELEDIFTEYDDAIEQTSVAPDVVTNLSLMRLVKDGVEYLERNMIVPVIVGAYLLCVVVCTGILVKRFPEMIAYPLSAVLAFTLFSALQVGMLRKNRMQIVTSEYLSSSIRRSGFSLFTISVITGLLSVGIPCIAAIHFHNPLLYGLIVFPGSFVWFLLFFAPLLVIDRGISSFAAMGHSGTLWRKIGFGNLVVLYTLWMTNYILGATGILLVITLPLTIVVMCDIYDSYFNQYRD